MVHFADSSRLPELQQTNMTGVEDVLNILRAKRAAKACQNCGEEGHATANCQQSRVNNPKCRQCGQRGHLRHGWLAETCDSFKEALAEVSMGLKEKLAEVLAGVKWLKDSIFGAVGDWLRWFDCLVGFVASLVAVSILTLAIGLVDKHFARRLWVAEILGIFFAW